jgi:hypothetical protein
VLLPRSSAGGGQNGAPNCRPKAYLKRKLGLPMTEVEKRSLPAAPEAEPGEDDKAEIAAKA